MEPNTFKVKVTRDGLNTLRGEIYDVKAATIENADYFTIVDYGRLHGASILINNCTKIRN
ncbi:hypothetical protein PCURB6_27830 [Paenibacillus curdlanolyticus]|nr:hypothetical protein PCURB6_27830 [Paenibacillus curdlanolyticus]